MDGDKPAIAVSSLEVIAFWSGFDAEVDCRVLFLLGEAWVLVAKKLALVCLSYNGR